MLVGAAACPAGERVRRIGVITILRIADFQHGLQPFGWADGRNLRIDYRFRLLLQGFCQFPRPRLHLLKQPRVLDGDDRLIGEGVDQLIGSPLRNSSRAML